MSGKLIAHVGNMGAGKTKKLVSLFNKLSEKGKNVIVFKHNNDVLRDGYDDMVISRNGKAVPAHAIGSLAEILLYESDSLFDAVLIDEIQFFNDVATIETLEAMAMVGVEVHVFGLDVTSDLTTFGLMGEILARADEVDKLKCRCHRCGSSSRVSEYIGEETKVGEVKVGDIGDYAPTCRACFYEITSNKADEKVSEDVMEDKLHELRLMGDEFGLDLGVYDSDLEKAGYSIDDVKDINSSVGIINLLRDLGYKIEG